MTDEKQQQNTELAAQPKVGQASLSPRLSESEAGAPEEREELKKQAEEYLNNWKRERADFINYKKDEGRRMEEFLKFSTEGIIAELIDVIDGIEVSRKNLPDIKELKEWITGFDSSLDKLDKFLKKFGVEKISVKGERFDPLLHEAVEVQDKDGDKIEEIRPGYTMHNKVIRPARVKIVN